MKTLFPLAIALSFVGCSDTAGPPRTKSAATPDAEGFLPLDLDVPNIVGETKDGQTLLPTPVDVSRATDTFAVRLKIGGKSRGYVYTSRPFRNFTLRFDVRWPNAAELPEEERLNANTGVLVFITGEHKVWPKCLEVQGKWSELCHIKSNAKDVSVEVRDDEAAREKARKPPGEWNSVEIVAKDGALTSYLNGTKIAESDPTELREGPIGFQAERYDVEFRHVRIREE